MIEEIIVITGLAAAATLAFIIIYLLRYTRGFVQDLDEFRRSFSVVTILLIALLAHSIYLLGKIHFVPFQGVFEIISLTLLLYLMTLTLVKAFKIEIAREAKKGEKVAELFKQRTLQDRFNETSIELIEMKNFFNSIIQSSADAIIASDASKKITYFSKGAEELFEIKAKEVIGKPVLNLYPSHFVSRRERIKRAKNLKEHGSLKNIKMWVNTPGGIKTISLSLSILKDHLDNQKGTVGIARDVTSEERAQRQISYLKDLNEKIIEGAPEGILLLDMEYTIKMVNNGFEKISGISKQEVIGKKATDYMRINKLVTLLDAIKMKQKFAKVVYEKADLPPAEVTVMLNGSEKTLLDYWTPLLDNDGKVEHALVILQDITTRKALEEDLKKKAVELQRSNELKDIFTDIMRHDLLNPIGVIKNYIELISEEELNPGIKTSVDAVMRNANKAVDMIENASRLSKIENEAEIQFEDLDAGKMLKEAVKLTRSRGKKKGVEIQVKAQGSFPIKAHPFLEDVFQNLLTNAIKYGKKDGVITAGVVEQGDTYKIFVADQGEGVPDKFKKTIFTRFERLKREGVKGTGLGLAIAKRIVEIHKGRIWVDDNPEGGSIFNVEVPKKPLNP